MKKCSRCGGYKDDNEFQIRNASTDGHTASCKKCLSLYDKARANLPHRIQARKQYAQTKNGKIAHTKATTKYKKTYPNKYKATNIINNAIRDGKLYSEPCQECGKNITQAHHDDYMKALNIRWLCAAHHKQWHKKNGGGLNPF